MNLIPRDLFNNLLDDFFNVPASKNNIMKVDIFEKKGFMVNIKDHSM